MPTASTKKAQESYVKYWIACKTAQKKDVSTPNSKSFSQVFVNSDAAENEFQ